MKAYLNSLRKSDPKAVLIFLLFMNAIGATIIGIPIAYVWRAGRANQPKFFDNSLEMLRNQIDQSNDVEFLRRNARIGHESALEANREAEYAFNLATENMMVGAIGILTITLGNSVAIWTCLRAIKKQAKSTQSI